MASLIDPNQPPQGQATTAALRANFAAAKAEIEELQAKAPAIFVLFSAVNVAVSWANLPATETVLPTYYATLRQIDLTKYTQARFFVIKGPTAGSATAHVHLGINPIMEDIGANYLPVLNVAFDIPINNINQLHDTGWQNIEAAAKINGWVGVIGDQGNGTLDPQFLGFYAYFR